MQPVRVMAVAILGVVAACGGGQRAGAPAKPRVVIEGTSIRILDGTAESVPIEILFGVDSDVLAASSRGALDALAIFLGDNTDLALVEVHGHSDERGTEQYNLDLSRRRAQSVIDYLVRQGVPPARLRGKGFGARRPAAPGADESAWSQNRRVEFVIVSQQSAR